MPFQYFDTESFFGCFLRKLFFEEDERCISIGDGGLTNGRLRLCLRCEIEKLVIIPAKVGDVAARVVRGKRLLFDLDLFRTRFLIEHKGVLYAPRRVQDLQKICPSAYRKRYKKALA